MKKVKFALSTSFIFLSLLIIQNSTQAQKRQSISLNEEWIVKSLEGDEKRDNQRFS